MLGPTSKRHKHTAARRDLSAVRYPGLTELTLTLTPNPHPDHTQASLSYGGAAALSVADRQLCFPRSDATCAAQLVGADRDFRNLLRNGCLSSLREVDYELEYLARCQVSKPLSRPILLAHHTIAR